MINPDLKMLVEDIENGDALKHYGLPGMSGRYQPGSGQQETTQQTIGKYVGRALVVGAAAGTVYLTYRATKGIVRRMKRSMAEVKGKTNKEAQVKANVKYKKASEMSDDELRKVVSRLQLEENYRNLVQRKRQAEHPVWETTKKILVDTIKSSSKAWLDKKIKDYENDQKQQQNQQKQNVQEQPKSKDPNAQPKQADTAKVNKATVSGSSYFKDQTSASKDDIDKYKSSSSDIEEKKKKKG